LANFALSFGLPFPIALLLGGIVAGLCGILIDRLLFRPLRQRGADPLLAMIASLGANIAIVNAIQYLVGAENYNYPPRPFGTIPAEINFGTASHPVPVRTIPIIIFLISMVVVALLTLWITRTKAGKALQAVAQDPLTARLLGINPDRLILLTFFVSGLLGGVAGTLVGVNVSIAGPYFGEAFALKGVSVIILGGLGSVPGAIVGGLALGLIEAFVPSQYNGYKDAIAFALLFVILLIRPEGLLGRAVAQKV
jgi:branched-chain amino acid transport system permease protein